MTSPKYYHKKSTLEDELDAGVEVLFFLYAGVEENEAFKEVLEVVDLDLAALEVFQVRVVNEGLVY